jgi:signal transduction histidine kinase
LLPRSLAGRLIALLLLALVATQAISFVIFTDERRLAVRETGRHHIIARTASIIRLLQDTPAPLHRQIIKNANTANLKVWLSRESAVDPAAAIGLSNRLHRRLDDLLGGIVREVRVTASEPRRGLFDWRARWRHDGGDLVGDGRRRDHDRERWRDRRGPRELTISVLMRGDQWLNVATVVPPPPPDWAWPSLVSMAVMAAAIAIIVVVVVRRITRPMQELAVAADGLGRGEMRGPVAEKGPEEVRRTTRAFNRMRERLQRFVDDRTRMLAAISHDLRTPITTLRLRAELLDDEEARRKILDTLDDMEQMTEATLAFAREEAAAEDTRKVDLAALVSSICADLSDIGRDVVFADATPTPYACRSAALKRAIRNLIENAVTYGTRARVHLEDGNDDFKVIIDDEGPGIPAADFERVFTPFVRLEESRSRDTGGIGLGMSIARSIIRSHGGDIVLANRAADASGGPAGLRATITLPKAAPS